MTKNPSLRKRPRSSTGARKKSMRNPAADRGWTRRPLHRIYEIHTWVKAGRYPNCQQLAKELEMTAKTVQRDINFMRDELNLPLAYDEQRHGYFYEKPVGDFPLLQLSRRELVTLFLARQALATVRGTRLEQELAQTFERLTAGLSDEVSFSWSELDAAFSVRATGVVEADARLFGALSDAILQGREVAFAYRKLTSDAPENRKVRPYHLGQVDHGWYLFGYDLDRGAVRTFALPRISALEVSIVHFERPADFTLRNHLGGSFGVWNYPEAGDEQVRVVFRGYAARVVAERRWHPSQEIMPWRGRGVSDTDGEPHSSQKPQRGDQETPDGVAASAAAETPSGEEGAIELRLRLRGLEEVARWILSWGRWAEVLAPVALKDRVREEAAAVVRGWEVGFGEKKVGRR